ncbi:MAG: hypothetical protein ACRD1O_13270, partial [Terriglobia bacterium]
RYATTKRFFAELTVSLFAELTVSLFAELTVSLFAELTVSLFAELALRFFPTSPGQVAPPRLASLAQRVRMTGRNVFQQTVVAHGPHFSPFATLRAGSAACNRPGKPQLDKANAAL